MIFQVFRNGIILMWTDHVECVPDREACMHMRKAGYTFKLNGKVFNPKIHNNQGLKDNKKIS
jgi:hypothetical protein